MPKMLTIAASFHGTADLALGTSVTGPINQALWAKLLNRPPLSGRQRLNFQNRKEGITSEPPSPLCGIAEQLSVIHFRRLGPCAKL